MARAACVMRLHGQQHALHIGMLDDRAHASPVAPGRLALPALAGIGKRLLVGGLGDGDALHADIAGGHCSSS